MLSHTKLLRHYFEKETSSALIVDHEAIKRTLDRYMAAFVPPFELVTTLIWSGFTAPQSFSVGNGIHFRPITRADYHELGRELSWLLPNGSQRLPYPSSRDWITEIRQFLPTQTHGTPTEIIRRLVVGLSLAVPGKAEAYNRATQFADPFLRAGRLFNPTPLSTARLGDGVALSVGDIENFRTLYARLEEVDTEKLCAISVFPCAVLRQHAPGERIPIVWLTLLLGWNLFSLPTLKISRSRSDSAFAVQQC